MYGSPSERRVCDAEELPRATTHDRACESRVFFQNFGKYEEMKHQGIVVIAAATIKLK